MDFIETSLVFAFLVLLVLLIFFVFIIAEFVNSHAALLGTSFKWCRLLAARCATPVPNSYQTTMAGRPRAFRRNGLHVM
jgi:hypothetical protein